MKRLIIFLSLIISLYSQAQSGTGKKLFPAKPIGWVSDFENDLTPIWIAYIDSTISGFEKHTSIEIGVVTLSLDSTMISSDKEWNALAMDLFNTWGIGEKDKNNGLLLLVSKKLRRVRIVTGEGIRNKLTDEEAKAIIETIMIPSFKKGLYGQAIDAGLQAIRKELQ